MKTLKPIIKDTKPNKYVLERSNRVTLTARNVKQNKVNSMSLRSILGISIVSVKMERIYALW